MSVIVICIVAGNLFRNINYPGVRSTSVSQVDSLSIVGLFWIGEHMNMEMGEFILYTGFSLCVA